MLLIILLLYTHGSTAVVAVGCHLLVVVTAPVPAPNGAVTVAVTEVGGGVEVAGIDGETVVAVAVVEFASSVGIVGDVTVVGRIISVVVGAVGAVETIALVLKQRGELNIGSNEGVVTAIELLLMLLL